MAWASACLDRTSSSALWAGMPLCAHPLTSALTTPGASRPRTRLVLRPRSRSVAEKAGTKDPPAPPLPQRERPGPEASTRGQQSTPAPGGPEARVGGANRNEAEWGSPLPPYLSHVDKLGVPKQGPLGVGKAEGLHDAVVGQALLLRRLHARPGEVVPWSGRYTVTPAAPGPLGQDSGVPERPP